MAYVLTSQAREEDEARQSIYVVPVDGSTAPRRFSQGKKDHTPRWSPDGRYLAFVSDRGEKNQVFLAPLEGGEPRQVMRAKWGAGQPAWSPDGRRLAYTARIGDWKEPGERKGAEKHQPRVIRDLRFRLDGVGYFDERRVHVFICHVESGEEKQITTGDYFHEHPAWSPDGKTIAFVSDRGRQRQDRQFRSDVWIVSAAGGRPKRLTRGRGAASSPAFSPDGKWVAFVGHESGDAASARNIHLYVVPADGKERARSVSESLDRPVAGWPPMGGQTVRWSGDSKSLSFAAADHGRISLYRANLKGEAGLVLDGERQIEAFAVSPDESTVAFVAAWPNVPSELYAAPLGNGRRERNLSRANDQLVSEVDLESVKRVAYRAEDGLEIEAFVIYPRGYRKGQRYPLAVNVHGGPHSMHPGVYGLAEYQSLAAAGFVVMLPNPRGSTGYGEAFSEAVVRDWGGGDFRDIMAGVEHLVTKGIADPERLYIGGYSYGGYMSSWAVGHTDLFRAAVVGAPVSNLVSAFGTGDIPGVDVFELGGIPQENLDWYIERSPITHLKNCNTPVLLMHHEGDLRCPIEQSEEIFQALKSLKKEVEFVRYPGGFHRYATHSPGQHVDRVKRTIAWYSQHQPQKSQAKSSRKRPAAARR